jgi:hypothetical protein
MINAQVGSSFCSGVLHSLGALVETALITPMHGSVEAIGR